MIKRQLAVELVLLTLAAVVAAGALPLRAGYLGWSWDALNHHIYLGYMAESPRLLHDVAAASVQSVQYPYLYWPVYRMSLLQGDGAWVAAAWSATQAALIVPPLWLLALRLLPRDGGAVYASVLRIGACVMGLASTVVLTGLDTTSNDLLAAVPLLWALALSADSRHQGDRRAFAAACLWGVSAAFKLSNAVFLPLLILWWWQPADGVRQSFRPRRALALLCGALAGFGAAYAPWGWHLLQATGNPFYPYLPALFSPAGR
ncbi:MAG: hypothetical protein MUC86_06485 [Burkholderiaceae bacterium]|jgi:hypothetical protein|nr:hypothetical protein [Burkholderiaceae bacterium]